MSDRTHVQLIVHDCPPDQAAAVLSIIDQHDLHLEYVEDGQPADGQLGLGLTYMDPEVVCGSAQLIAQELEQSAPGASWEVWEDPKYEWLGDLYRFTPTFGPWTANCDAEGTPVFTPDEVHRLAVLPNTVDEPARARALGEAHADALRALAARNEGIVLDPND
ncbi:hypothetical protein [Brevibacterium oceani]|uniref:hypothetical protein n=1 Tax=Brevibacterium oceani TaxID=358099 RepID=UPI0015E70F4E|nr:hypothetical protein [Brevibacterium oceani]